MASELIPLLTHAYRWLVNLRRASRGRRQASVRALQQLVKVARQTAVYLRHKEQDGKPDPQLEMALCDAWGDLSFRLKELGLTALAKKCDVRSRLWAWPDTYDSDYVRKAAVQLDTIEKEARHLLERC
jgi:hypothetical protein